MKSMKSMMSALKRFSLVAAGCLSLACMAADKKPADQLEKLTVDGKERTMLVYAPDGLPKKDAPLVISLHGFRQDAFFQRGQSHWNDCADENKFVVVYPNGIDTWWDVGGMRDVKFIEAVIEEMSKRYKIDRKRIYVTGFSLGAMMTYQCMEHLSEKVAAFGPVSGVRFDNRPPKSAKPVSFLHVHGTGDNVFWWKGDLKHPAGGYPSIPEYVGKWANHQGLDVKTEKKNYPRKDSHSSLTTWKKRGSNVEIGLLALEGKGHWHSEDPAHSASTTRELWEFFKRHPLQASAKASAVSVSPTYRNPSIFADCPDVSLCCDGKYYYMVSTTMHMVPGAPVMRSKDMLRWETIGYVFDRFDFSPEFSLDAPNGKTAYSGGQWASSFRYHKGKFYCYFVANGHGGFLYTADKAEGPWKLYSREPFMHDASLLFDDDGKVWVFHGDGWLTLMNDDLTGVAPGWKNIRLFDRSDETALLEGSAAFKKDGWYYLMMVSAFMPGHPRREVCYRSRNVKGPYEKKVILETEFDHHGGVGQGCVVKGPDGSWRALVFQDRGGVGRTPCLMPVRWEDDWPMLGDESGRIPNDETKPYPDLTGIVGSDSFSSAVLDKRWQWNHNPVDSAWSLKERQGWMRLHANEAPNLFVAKNTLTQRMLGPTCDAEIKMDVSKMKDGDRAGFAAFQGDSAVAEIAMENGRRTISLSRQTAKFRNANGRFFDSLDREDHAKEELKGDVVWLRVRGDFRRGQDWAEVAWSDDGNTWHWAGKHVPMRFDIGKFFMGARFAIFNYATKSAGGHVDVDKFVVRTEEHESPAGGIR